MDIVLEILDTFVGDGVYATLLPNGLLQNDLDSALHSADQQLFPVWRYEPATAYLYLEPSEAAYMSYWPRDNIYRQAISLFSITLYVRLPRVAGCGGL